MEKKVIISVKGIQHFEGQPQDTMELVTPGTLTDHGERGMFLSYRESELTGMEGTTTTFCLEKSGRVTLLRCGTTNSQMIFEEGRRHLSLYRTPFGDMALGVLAKRIRNRLDLTGGELEIDYTIELDRTVTGHSRFRLEVREENAPAQ